MGLTEHPTDTHRIALGGRDLGRNAFHSPAIDYLGPSSGPIYSVVRSGLSGYVSGAAFNVRNADGLLFLFCVCLCVCFSPPVIVSVLQSVKM